MKLRTSGLRERAGKFFHRLKPHGKHDAGRPDAGGPPPLTNVNTGAGLPGPSNLPPSPLRESSADIKRFITQYLTFAEIVRFIRVCRGARESLQAPEHKDGARGPGTNEPVTVHAWMRVPEVAAALNPLCADGDSTKVEAVLFHFAKDRVGGTRRALPETAASQLRTALTDGNVPVLQAGLREFLSVPAPLVPSDLKVAHLCEPDQRCVLEDIATSACGRLDAGDRRKYDAVKVYVDEIVSSPYLTTDQKVRLCVDLKPIHPKPLRPRLTDTVAILPLALRRNPACAAAILRGIAESGASLEVKRKLLASASASARMSEGQLIDAAASGLREHLQSHESRDESDRDPAAVIWLREAISQLAATPLRDILPASN